MLSAVQFLRSRPCAGVIAGICLGVCLSSTPAWSGYSQPAFIDGGQSVDGRYTVSAELIEKGKHSHGPHKWRFTWTDKRTNESHHFEPQQLTRGQIYGHIYVAPDGQTFALWNHVTLWWDGKSHDHAHEVLPRKSEIPAKEWQHLPQFSHRLTIYRKDGSILKSFSVADFLEGEEWETVQQVFNRVHWIKEYPELKFKQTPRPGYAFHRISPDYTILEFLPTTSRANRRKPPRVVRVDLTTGEVLAADAFPTEESKVPVRPYLGDAHLGGTGPEFKETYRPSLDPLRVPPKILPAPDPR